MKRAICLIVSILFFCSLSVGTYAMGMTDEDCFQNANSRLIVDRFFSKQFTVYGKNGENITDEFYATLTAEYENGNYDVVLNYLQEYVSYAEATEKIVTPIVAADGVVSPRSSHDNVSVIRSFYKMVDDEVHGYSDHNVIAGDAKLDYVVNSNEGTIVSASAPTIQWIELQYMYGDLPPTVTVSNRRATVASNSLSATFSFHVDASIYVQSIIYPEVNPMGLAYRYSADFSFTETP